MAEIGEIGRGTYFDGETAAARGASIRIEAGALVISPEDGARAAWPLKDVREVPGQAGGALILRLAGGGAARLIAEDPGLRRYMRRAAPYLRRREPVRGKPRLMLFGMGAIASVLAILFALVPMLAGQLARVMPPEGERALGLATLDQVRTIFGQGPEAPLQFCEAEEGKAALWKIFGRIARGPELPYPVDLHVMETGMVNAFALPGGQIVVMEGLITAAESPEEVAAVLAHELAHVVHRDPTRDALRSAGSIGVLGLFFGDFAGGGLALVLMNQLINADYSQEAEAAADAFALRQIRENGLPPAALATFFRRLQAEGGEPTGILAHLASHPELGDRIAAAETAEPPENPRPLLSEEEWSRLRWICGF